MVIEKTMELKKNDIVRVKARMAFGTIDIKCQLVARRWRVFYWLKALEPAGPIKAGEIIWGTLSDIAEKLEDAPENVSSDIAGKNEESY